MNSYSISISYNVRLFVTRMVQLFISRVKTLNSSYSFMSFSISISHNVHSSFIPFVKTFIRMQIFYGRINLTS